MMNVNYLVLMVAAATVVGYLLGSISFGVLLSRLLHRDDIRQHGSGNAGMTNALRVYGSKMAIFVFAGDFLKGALAVWLGQLLCGTSGVQLGAMAAALGVVLGHLFPVFFGFRGGKGLATAAGAILVLNPVALVILAIPFALIVLLTRYMSLASVTVAAFYPVVTAVLAFGFGGSAGALQWCEVGAAAILGGLVVFMHRSNIGRLLAGTESKVGQKAEK